MLENMINIALVGNPNSGKTTLFNQLTGSHQRVGNWSGVTVDKKEGEYSFDGQRHHVLDLPGAYTLSVFSESSAVDEYIACREIFNAKQDVIVNIVDATHLERSLYLTSQLLEMQVPMVLAVNMIDVARKNHVSVDTQKLEKLLGCPVVPIQANRAEGLDALKKAIAWQAIHQKKPSIQPEYPAVICQSQAMLSDIIQAHSSDIDRKSAQWFALRALEGDLFALEKMSVIRTQALKQQQYCEKALEEELDITIADARYQLATKLQAKTVKRLNNKRQCKTDVIDKIVLNRFLGIPIFFLAMYSLFFFAINIGGALQDFFDIASATVFVDGLAALLQSLHAPTWLIAVLATGVGKGINTVITFIPVVGSLFFFLSLLEDSGYMTRAAFVMDRAMRALGLPGKAFVPMIVGFGCNVPAVMAARTLENPRDRILTIMMSPFMSCGARLSIYAIFVAAFFPHGGQNVVFTLYLIGIAMAVMTGIILRKTVLNGAPSPLILELPHYHMPTWQGLCRHTWRRLHNFLVKAGRFIIPVCLLLGALNAFGVNGQLYLGDAHTHSVMSWIGHTLTPLFSPMGIQPDNWPATVGLATGVLAKEVVVATLNTLYMQAAHLSMVAHDFHFWVSMKEAFLSIPNNLIALKQAFYNPIAASMPAHEMTQSAYGIMFQRFGGQLAAFAYLLFVLLYFPCVSTTAVMQRELGWRWTIFSVAWTTGLAYSVAVLVYQVGTWASHPAASLSWITGILTLLVCTFSAMRLMMKTPSGGSHVC